MIFFNLNIEATLQKLLLQEDTDGDKRITIEDKGPKAFEITSSKREPYMVKGTYHLSNLLQELVIALIHSATKSGSFIKQAPNLFF